MIENLAEERRELSGIARVDTPGGDPELGDEAVIEVPVRALRLDWSVRVGGSNGEHLRLLADLDEALPPIVVQHPSMTVIDGVHRVRVALMCGRQTIMARLFRGSDRDAFVLAVRLNAAHGLALSRDDRNAAAEKIIHSHPQWSDRMIAKIAGLSAGTVAGIRKRSTDQIYHSNTRIGLDGRARHVNGEASRKRVTDLLARKPEASIRAIAHEAGVSPSTVHEARKRMSLARTPPTEPDSGSEEDGRDVRVSSLRSRQAKAGARLGTTFDINDTIGVLTKDPSIRLTETGRRMIRLLHRSAVDCTAYGELVDRIPEHCVFAAAKLARQFARRWALVAESLEQRHRRQTS